ncbi:MAG: hypothetical protein ACREM6_07720 [Vulcanimicrobiaceae bacterium]
MELLERCAGRNLDAPITTRLARLNCAEFKNVLLGLLLRHLSQVPFPAIGNPVFSRWWDLAGDRCTLSQDRDRPRQASRRAAYEARQ